MNFGYFVSDKEFVITMAQTYNPMCGTAYTCSEPRVLPLSYPGALHDFFKNGQKWRSRNADFSETRALL